MLSAQIVELTAQLKEEKANLKKQVADSKKLCEEMSVKKQEKKKQQQQQQRREGRAKIIAKVKPVLKKSGSKSSPTATSNKSSARACCPVARPQDLHRGRVQAQKRSRGCPRCEHALASEEGQAGERECGVAACCFDHQSIRALHA